MRRTLSAVLLVAGLRVLLIAIGVGARWVNPESTFAEVSSLVIALALPAIAAAFFVGLFQRRLYAADALQKLAARITGGSTPEEMRAALADALQDPSLQIVYWANGQRNRWVDAAGNAVDPPAPDSGLALSEIKNGDRIVAGIVHDSALSGQRDFIEAVGSYALVALENRRLTAKVESSLREVRKSRSRILASADRERRRLERDLHDGAQQRLVALRIQLELTEELVARDPERGIAKLHAPRRGRRPDARPDQGAGARRLSLALGRPRARRGAPRRVAGASGRVAAQRGEDRPVSGRGRERRVLLLPRGGSERDEARRRTRASSRSRSRTATRCASRVATTAAGSTARSPRAPGLTNMRDRLAAIGGELEITSAVGQGTVVTGTVPLQAG